MKTSRIQFDDRADHLAEIKRQVVAGTYDTRWRLSLALDALLDEIEVDDAEVDQGEFDLGHDADEDDIDYDEPGARPRQPR